MKALTFSLLLTASIILGAAPGVAAGGTMETTEEVAKLTTGSSDLPSGNLKDQPPGASAQDLSLFGIISLGVIGLFWIRRHTSEL